MLSGTSGQLTATFPDDHLIYLVVGRRCTRSSCCVLTKEERVSRAHVTLREDGRRRLPTNPHLHHPVLTSQGMGITDFWRRDKRDRRLPTPTDLGRWRPRQVAALFWWRADTCGALFAGQGSCHSAGTAVKMGVGRGLAMGRK